MPTHVDQLGVSRRITKISLTKSKGSRISNTSKIPKAEIHSSRTAFPESKQLIPTLECHSWFKLNLPRRCVMSCLWHNDSIFAKASKATISTFSLHGKQKGQAAEDGLVGMFGFQSGQKNLALHIDRTTFVQVFHCSPSCCQLLHVFGRTDDTGLSRTYVPTNPGEVCQRTSSHFTKRSCWWLVLWVCTDMQAVAGRDTDRQYAVKLQYQIWLSFFNTEHVKPNTIMIAWQRSKNIMQCATTNKLDGFAATFAEVLLHAG